MKGLLLKDLYMANKHCRTYLFITALFIAISLSGNDNMLFAFYPCLLGGMVPVNLLSYDERNHWLQYSCSLPYTRAQIVSAKYIIGLICQIAMLIITAVAQAIKMCINGNFSLARITAFMLLMLATSTFTSSISLPFMFKMGVEKGRMFYYVMIGFVCGGSVLASQFLGGHASVSMQENTLLAIISLAGIGVYALSWYLSVVFYEKREIQ